MFLTLSTNGNYGKYRHDTADKADVAGLQVVSGDETSRVSTGSNCSEPQKPREHTSPCIVAYEHMVMLSAR